MKGVAAMQDDNHIWNDISNMEDDDVFTCLLWYGISEEGLKCCPPSKSSVTGKTGQASLQETVQQQTTIYNSSLTCAAQVSPAITKFSTFLTSFYKGPINH